MQECSWRFAREYPPKLQREPGLTESTDIESVYGWWNLTCLCTCTSYSIKLLLFKLVVCNEIIIPAKGCWHISATTCTCTQYFFSKVFFHCFHWTFSSPWYSFSSGHAELIQTLTWDGTGSRLLSTDLVGVCKLWVMKVRLIIVYYRNNLIIITTDQLTNATLSLL